MFIVYLGFFHWEWIELKIRVSRQWKLKYFDEYLFAFAAALYLHILYIYGWVAIVWHEEYTWNDNSSIINYGDQVTIDHCVTWHVICVSQRHVSQVSHVYDPGWVTGFIGMQIERSMVNTKILNRAYLQQWVIGLG